jgi:JmjC domain.
METHKAFQTEHPLSLTESLETSIEKLIRYKIVDTIISTKDDDDVSLQEQALPVRTTTTTPPSVTYQLHPHFACPRPSKNVYSAIQLAKNIGQVRRDAECEFWCQHPRPKIDVDRVRLVHHCGGEEGEDSHNHPCHEQKEASNGAAPAAATTTGNCYNRENAHEALQPHMLQHANLQIMTALQFKQKYLYTNTPCIIKNIRIPITQQWYQSKPRGQNRDESRSEYQINTNWFLENIGCDTLVPIRINQEGYQDGRAAECKTTKVTMKSWIEERTNNPNPQHYLKDWHMQSLFQKLYEDPIVFDDILNPFLLDNDGGDYRFVYWGCKGSSTGIHSDVLNTFSWSFNVIGTKRWTFYHKDDLNGSGEGAIVVDQHQGEMMYVPSGWRHSVVNLEEAISVNHNWMMVGSLDFVFECLLDEIKAIEDEMDAWGMTGSRTIGLDNELSRVREDMLRGCVGMDISMFCMLIIRCFTNCLIGIMDPERGLDGPIDRSQDWECWFDFTRIVKILGKILETAIYDERDPIIDDFEYEDDKVIIDMKGRLHSTLAQSCAEQTIDLMHLLYDIGCRTVTVINKMN